jgi:hypothetical protein
MTLFMAQSPPLPPNLPAAIISPLAGIFSSRRNTAISEPDSLGIHQPQGIPANCEAFS